jgi:hypothetical protein
VVEIFIKPIVHARLSAKKYGGVPEDYIRIHDFLDSTKMALPDVRHRAILHSAFGCFIVEDVFGHTLTTLSGELDATLRAFKHDPSRRAKEAASGVEGRKIVSVRDIAEDHIREDLNFIPTIERWLRSLPMEPWMAGSVGRYPGEEVD